MEWIKRPNWLSQCPDLWDSVPGFAETVHTQTAHAALQRILDAEGVDRLLLPLLPPGHDKRRLQWVCDILRTAACAVDTPYRKMEDARANERDSATSFANELRARAVREPQHAIPLRRAADEDVARDALFNGPPPFERPGPKLPERRAAQMLFHVARGLHLKEPDLRRLIAALVIAVFRPEEAAGDAPGRAKALRKKAEWVRGVIRAEKARLGWK